MCSAVSPCHYVCGSAGLTIDDWPADGLKQPIREQDSVVLMCVIPLRSGNNLFSRMSLASVPSSIKSSLVITPMVLRPEGDKQLCLETTETTTVTPG